MHENIIQILVTFFFVEYAASYLVSLLIVLGFSYEDREEKRWFAVRSIPVILFVNTLLFLAVTTAVFGRNNSFSDLLNILRVSRSYQDISRLALSATVCLCLSAVLPLLFGALYNRRNGGMAVRGRQKAAVLLLMAAAFVPFMMGLRIGSASLEQIRISAVCRKTVFPEGEDEYGRDTAGESYGYVEFFNDSPLACEVERLWLSDDPYALQSCDVRELRLAPYGSYRFIMTGSNSLNVRKSGGTVLYLSDAEGNILDLVSVPPLEEEEVLCRTGEDWSVVDLGADSRAVYVPTPVFSADSGFYDKSFHLSLYAPKGLKIYYTLDCTTPDTGSKLYDKKIYIYNNSILSNKYRSVKNVVPDYLRSELDGEKVPKAMIVRAVAADGEGNLSEVVTKTYFVGIARDSFGERQIVSLVSDPEGLFGENGIYITGAAYDAWYEKAVSHLQSGEPLNTGAAPLANFQKKGQEWEREANLELLSGGSSILNQPIGIRIQGNSSRNDALKRFSLFAREEYSGSDYFDISYPEGISCHSLLLRPGDFFAVSQLIAQGSHVDSLTPTPVAVFLDGEFWYNAYLYEKLDERNLAAKYDIAKDNIAIIKNGEIPPEANEGALSADYISAYYESLRPDDPEIYEKLSAVIDMQSFIDEICLQCYLANIDVQEYSNNLVWHTVLPMGSGADDSRWRWGLSDIDLTWESVAGKYPDENYYTIDPFVANGSNHVPVTQWRLFVLLRGNETFREQLMTTFMDMVNSRFYIPNVLSLLDSLGVEDKVMREFFANRLYYLVPRFAKELGYESSVGGLEISASVSGTPIKVNGISPELEDDRKWNGVYLTDKPLLLSTDREDFFLWVVTAEEETLLFDQPEIELSLTEGGVKVFALFK